MFSHERASLESMLRMVGLRWAILEKLYLLRPSNVPGVYSYIPPKIEGEPTPSWLSKELGKNLSEISRHISELERKGIIVCEKKGGAKHCSLTEEGLRLVSSICWAIEQIKALREGRLKVETEFWRIEEYLDTIEDTGLDENTRDNFARKLLSLVREDPVLAFTKCERLRKLVERCLKGEKLGGRIDEMIRATFSISLIRLASAEKTKEWVLGQLYSILIKKLEHEEPEMRKSAVDMLGNIGEIVPEVRENVFNIFLEKLGLGEKPPEAKMDQLADRLVGTIVHLATPQELRNLFSLSRKKAKSKDEKIRARAKLLLMEL